MKSTTKLVQAAQEDVMPFSASRTWIGKGIVTTIALFTNKTAPRVVGVRGRGVLDVIVTRV